MKIITLLFILLSFIDLYSLTFKSGFGFIISTINLKDIDYNEIRLQPAINIDNFNLILDLPIIFETNMKPYFTNFIDINNYILISYKNNYINIYSSKLENITSGSRTIVRDYYNSIYYPYYRINGLFISLNFIDNLKLNFFTDNIFNFEINTFDIYYNLFTKGGIGSLVFFDLKKDMATEFYISNNFILNDNFSISPAISFALLNFSNYSISGCIDLHLFNSLSIYTIINYSYNFIPAFVNIYYKYYRLNTNTYTNNGFFYSIKPELNLFNNTLNTFLTIEKSKYKDNYIDINFGLDIKKSFFGNKIDLKWVIYKNNLEDIMELINYQGVDMIMNFVFNYYFADNFFITLDYTRGYNYFITNSTFIYGTMSTVLRF